MIQHHERFDGSGYPHGLSGEDISAEAGIIAVADVFDAMTSHRPYPKGIPKTDTIDHMRSMGGRHFDPEILDIALLVFGEAQRPAVQAGVTGEAAAPPRPRRLGRSATRCPRVPYVS